MLLSVLAEFQAQPGPISASELAQRLGVAESALEGMMQTLVQQGRLALVGEAAAVCTLCPLTTLCVGSGGPRAYVLVERKGLVCDCAAADVTG